MAELEGDTWYSVRVNFKVTESSPVPTAGELAAAIASGLGQREGLHFSDFRLQKLNVPQQPLTGILAELAEIRRPR